MNYQYGLWNPKGTSNADYGRFSYQQAGGFGGGNRGQGHQHHPGCQHFQQGGQPHQMMYSNGNQGNVQFQFQEQNQGQDQGQSQGQPTYTVHYGHEAAAKALGGNVDYITSLNLPQNPYASETGAMAGVQMEDNSTLQPVGTSGGGEEAYAEGQGTMPQTAQPGQQQEQGGDAGAGTGATDKPASATSKLPQKWKGIPPTVQYGRHVKPRMSQFNMKMQPSGMMPPSEPNGGGDMNPYQYQQQYQQQMNYPGQGQDSNANMNMAIPMPSGSGSMSKMRMQVPPNINGRKLPPKQTPAEAKLCGKCSKCKSFLPQDDGPSVLNFANQTIATFQRPNVRSMHNMGRQDAKNFRAVRYQHMK